MLKLRSNLLLAGALGFFVFLCFYIENHQFMVGVKNNLQVNHVPSELLSYNKLGEMFHSLDLIQIVPNHSDRFKQKYDLSQSDDLGPFQKRRQISGALIETGGQHESLKTAVDNIRARANRANGVAISVVTEPENIQGEYGILANHQQRGRNWERLAYVAIEKGDKLIANSAAGLRLHGGTSRDPSLEKHSYRLYYRKKYGEQKLTTADFFTDLEALRTLVVHVDIPKGWPLNNVIANRIYDMIGVPTVEYSQAEFFLNGENQGLYWLSSHLSEKYLKKKYGINVIHYQRYRGQEKNQIYRDDIGRLESEAFTPLTAKALTEVVDLEGLMDYFIAVTYSGNTDWNQGVGFKDAEDVNSKWRWVAWDLDHSFIDWYVAGSRNPARKVWQQDGLGLIFDARMHKVKSKRQRIFRRLFAEDPQFQQIFVNRYLKVLNHDLSVDKLIDLYAEYEEIAGYYGVEMNPQLLGFFKHRHAHMRWELQQYFKLPEFLMLKIEGDERGQVIIDGSTEKLPYIGYYPAGSPLTINLADNNLAKGGSFIVNGEVHLADSLSLKIERTTTVELVDN